MALGDSDEGSDVQAGCEPAAGGCVLRGVEVPAGTLDGLTGEGRAVSAALAGYVGQARVRQPATTLKARISKAEVKEATCILADGGFRSSQALQRCGHSQRCRC
jgi:hypothetical protein